MMIPRRIPFSACATLSNSERSASAVISSWFNAVPFSYRPNSNFEYVLESVFFFDFTRATTFGVRMSLTARPIR